MAIDRGDAHVEEAGDSWERACRHIGLFLWWAAERGLTSAEHPASAIAANPTEYVISRCDTKLWDCDLSDEGNAFAASDYAAYLAEVSAYAKRAGVGDYAIPEGEPTTRHFFQWLDGRLLAWRAAR